VSCPKEWKRTVQLKDGTRVLLRPELSTDTEMLWEMFSTLSKASRDKLVEPVTRERIESWTSDIDYERNLPILAVVNDGQRTRVVGSGSLSFYASAANRHKAELGITVHDDYQNRGLGTVMIGHLLRIARQKGLRKVFLLVNTDNRQAIHVYEKCGFTIEARLVKEYSLAGELRDDYRMAVFL
jgi:RimJ/RimL family protein N-acetyltransferase